MAEAPAVTPLGAATLNRDWRLEVDTGSSGIDVAGTAATTDVITAVAHGLLANQPVAFSTVVAGLSQGVTYYVRDVATDTFKVSTTPGGTAVDITAAGAVVAVRGPVWTVVRGRTDFKPGLDSTLQDDSDMDSQGWKSQTRTAAQWMMEFKVVRKAITLDLVGGATSSYDPGQEALRVAADQIGPYNSVSVRWYKLGAVRTEAYSGYAAVAWAPDGGGMDGLDTATVTLTGQGQRSAISHPYTLP